MSDFGSASTLFLDWFQKQPGTAFHEDLELTDLRSRGAGRGIIAKRRIAEGTELFSIPRSCVLCVENSEVSKRLPHIFTTLATDAEDDDAIKVPDPWIDMILVMIYEFLKGPQSKWSSYFAVLPDSFDTLMFWTQDELDDLQASAIKAKVGKQEADDMFREMIVPVLRDHAAEFYPPGSAQMSDAEVVQLAHRMGSIIMSYAFELEKEEEDESDGEDGWMQDKEGLMAMGMVPMADMLNADAEFNAHLNHDEEQLSMISIRPIEAGEEVLNFYGPLPNCDLLRRYGYTSEKHSRYDVVEISWDVIKAALQEQYKSIPKADVDEDALEDSFVLERDTGFPDEDGINRSRAIFTTFDEDLETQTNIFVASAMGIAIDGASKADVRRVKSGFVKVMTTALSKRLAQYQTTADQDEEGLSRGLQGRARTAVLVRLGEKRLLHEALTLVQNLQARYQQATTTEGQPAAKKQKTSR